MNQTLVRDDGSHSPGSGVRRLRCNVLGTLLTSMEVRWCSAGDFMSGALFRAPASGLQHALKIKVHHITIN
jgi:hypothetical protein